MTKQELKALRKPFIKQFFLHNKFNLVMTVLSSLIGSFVNIGISWGLQQVFDLVSGQCPYSLGTLVLIAVLLLGLLLLAGLLDWLFLPKFRARAVRQYKEYAFNELTKKGVQAFAGENTSTYISALSNDISAIETNTITVIQGVIQLAFSFIGALALMLFNNPLLTVIAICFSILPVVISILFGNRLAGAEKALSDRKESYLGSVKDALTGFAVIKSFRAESAIRKLHDEKTAEVEKAQVKRGKLNVIIVYISSIANAATQFGVFFVSAAFALSGMGVTAGTVALFVQLMNYLLMPIGEFPKFLANAKASAALIDKLALALNENTESGGETVAPELRKGIVMKDVSFAYEKDKPVLFDFDMELRPGSCWALVGGSGSGKSTVLNLLMGAWRDYGGSIAYDGREVRDIAPDSLYGAVSIIQQNVFIFNSTIRDNITMFSEFPEDEIERAVRLSGLSELIREKGSDCLCGENGSGLSGGERQRISIARALLRKTPVLFVDEATASLDRATSSAVLDSILSLEGFTRLIVTHDLNDAVLRKCDGVIALKNGRVAECGPFDELMERKGYFYSLFTVSQE